MGRSLRAGIPGSRPLAPGERLAALARRVRRTYALFASCRVAASAGRRRRRATRSSMLRDRAAAARRHCRRDARSRRHQTGSSHRSSGCTNTAAGTARSGPRSTARRSPPIAFPVFVACDTVEGSWVTSDPGALRHRCSVGQRHDKVLGRPRGRACRTARRCAGPGARRGPCPGSAPSAACARRRRAHSRAPVVRRGLRPPSSSAGSTFRRPRPH